MLTFDSEKHLCGCGCGLETKMIPHDDLSKGLVKGNYYKFLQYHRTKSPYQYLKDANGCWVWQRGKTSAGYGEFKDMYAHRYFYQAYKGPITKGFVIDHLCRNKGCVNPEHLEAVPHHINCQRGIKSKLTSEQVMEIKRLLDGDFLTNQQIGKIVGCSDVTVSSVKRQKRWAKC